ncbi:MAG: hypothetical protein M1835_005204 [Candelina submexicana]|nr:MAG: hypothetical protein M1835_005204 [Candelina submexicana]
MDIANQLFSLTLGVEPNKSTLKGFADLMNNAVLSLADKQKLLDQYAETAQSQIYTAAAKPPTPKPKIIYRDKKEIKVFKIDPAKLKELQWKRTQLLAAAKAQKEADAAAAKAAKTKGKKAPAPAAAKPKQQQVPANKAPSKPQAPNNKTPKAPAADASQVNGGAPQNKARKPSVATSKSSSQQVNGVSAKAQKAVPNGKAK